MKIFIQKIIWFLFVCTNLIYSQKEYFIPGGIDVVSKIFDSNLVPIPTSGFEGALRNPAMYMGGFTSSRQFINGPINNYLLLNSNSTNYDNIHLGIAYNSGDFDKIAQLSWGITFGSLIDHYNDSIDVKNWVIGLCLGSKIGKYFRINIGSTYFIPADFIWYRSCSNLAIGRLDLAAQITYKDFISIAAINRRITREGEADLDYRSIFRVSYLVKKSLYPFEFGVFGKLYSNPINLDNWDPAFYGRIYIYGSLIENGYFEVIANTAKAFSIGFSFAGWNLFYGINSNTKIIEVFSITYYLRGIF